MYFNKNAMYVYPLHAKFKIAHKAVGAASQCYCAELMLLKCKLMLLKCQINTNTNKNGFLLSTKGSGKGIENSYF